MRDIKVRRNELLEVIRANRDAHRTIFEKAQAAYRERVIEELDRRLADAKAGRILDMRIALPVPEDHTADYERVIKMLELSVDEHIELSEQDASWYVQDAWQWKAAWIGNTASYVVSE